MRLEHHAAILAVGTEVVSGQIPNGNATWLSRKLTDLGAEVVLHEAVPDERAMIEAALSRCAESARLIFVTGGLGPTSDDFTREVISKWMNAPLEFNPGSWTKIENRLKTFGITVAESNRQQCYFPARSQVLLNREGTADGFFLRHGASLVWVLPGPPKEIEAIWSDHAREMIRESLPKNLSRLKLMTWDCLGKSESELGEIVEEALKGSGLQTGYRVHRPYVEVKVWLKEAEYAEASPWISKLETAITPWLFSKQGEDIGDLWIDAIRRSCEPGIDVEIFDACTGGLLASRLSELLRKPAHRTFSNITLATEWEIPRTSEDWMSTTLLQADEEAATFAISGLSASENSHASYMIGTKVDSQVYQETLITPWKNIDLLERSRSFAVEMALKKWTTWLLKRGANA